MRRTLSVGAVVAALLLACAAAAAQAVVPLVAAYNARITGTVSEWNSFIPGYQVTGNVDLPALVFVEQRRSGARPDAPVVGIFTDQLPALDTRPGAINFATNSQGFHVVPSATVPTAAAIDVAFVQANVGAGTVNATVDETPARTVQLDMFRTQASFVSAPAQILAGTIALQFSADARSFTGAFDLGGNGLIEPGNPLFRVKRYTATLTGTAAGPVVLAGGSGGGGGGGGQGDVDEIVLRALRTPRGGLSAARRRGIAVAVTCPAACRARAVLRVSRATARRAGLRRRVVGAASASSAAGGRLAFRVRLTRRAKAQLAELPTVRVSARVSVRGDGAGAGFRRTLTLRAGGA